MKTFEYLHARNAYAPRIIAPLVYVQSPVSLEIYCKLDFTAFPFDKANITLELLWLDREPGIGMGSGINITDVSVSFLDEQSEVSMISNSDIWKFQDESQRYLVEKTSLMGVIPKITIKFPIARKQEYYIWTVFVPLELLMLLQLATFAMPPDTFERSAYSITVNLAFAVTQQVINGQMPKTSQTIYLFLYIGAYLMIGGAVTIYALTMARANWWPKKRRLGQTIDTMVFFICLVLAIISTIVYFAAVSYYTV